MIDRLIRLFAPGWAARRAIARLTAERVERFANNFRGARSTRVDPNRQRYPGGAPDAITESAQDRRDLVDRARLLEQDNGLAEALLSGSVRNILGTGLRLQCEDEAFCAKWAEWCEAGQCDSRKLLDFDELLSVLLRGYLRDGDGGFVLQDDGSLRVVESDEIATPTGGAFYDPKKVDGIDLDENGAPVTYYVIRQPRRLGDRRYYSTDAYEIPADRMIFVARRLRAGQTRGLSAFANVTWLLEQINGQIEAVTIAARMAACFGLIIKRHTKLLGLQKRGSQNRRQIDLEPGLIMELDPDEEAQQVTPHQPTINFSDFIRLLVRLVALPFGLPLEIALNDYSQANYSSSRAALIQAWQTWRQYQKLMRCVATRVLRWKALQWGLETTPKHHWIAPGWQWVDPEKETLAALAAVDAGFESRSNVAARLGLNLEEILRERAAEEALAVSLGVKLGHSTLTRPEEEPEGEGEEPGGEEPED